MTNPKTNHGTAGSIAAQIAQYLVDQGVERVYSLPGSHMKPIWKELDDRGVRIVTTRHEVAAVHMAQAEADLTGRLAVAIVTTGPGLTNAVTGIASAHLARSPILVLSTRVPGEQEGMGALEEIDQIGLVTPICRDATVVRSARHVLDRLDRAVSFALGDEGLPGPAYVEFPSDRLRDAARRAATTYPRRTRRSMPPTPDDVEAAVRLLAEATRPLVITGRDGLVDPDVLAEFVAATGAVYLDTRASKGAVSAGIETFVPAARGRAMTEADLVITIGRELDFEVGYGSPAVYRNATGFLRIGRSRAEVQANRRGDVELAADPALAMRALLDAGVAVPRADTAWREGLVSENRAKVDRLKTSAERRRTSDGALHPYELFDVVNEFIDDDTIVVVDGGDILSWSRSGLTTPTYLDLGPFGCLGAGVPFAVAASLTFPDRRVVLVTGDGALGFNVMELETAVREHANITVVVANNSAWNIERADQVRNYGGHILGTSLSDCAFDQVAEALGARGFRATDVDELERALVEAVPGPIAVVDVRISREPFSPDTLGGLALVPKTHVLAAWDDAEQEWAQGRDPQ